MLADWLRSKLPFKEIGWEKIEEQFTRYSIFRCKHFNIYLHRLHALIEAPECHDHPWGFITILLWNGYKEQFKGKWHRRLPGTIMLRRATDSHNVITPYGVSWSLIFTTKKTRDWGFLKCGD